MALRVLVTGGAQGIGLAIAEHLASQGDDVAVLDRLDVEIEGLRSFTADLGDRDNVEHAVAEAIHALGGLDVLVNNVGIGAVGGVADNDDDEWHKVLDVNVVGAVRVIRAALPALRLSPSASIVNVCSVAATVGLPQRVLYSASKGAVLAMTRAMAVDLLPDGIRVNAVNPGTTDTPWVQRLLFDSDDPAARLAALVARQPHGRLVSPHEVAAAVGYLASPAAGSTTGAELTVDGGLHSLRPNSAPVAPLRREDPGEG
ncbi:SDR family NAD(P)-dependent oxidoreductase [Actinocrispum wychmicini]|uniref:NAD(P)-dependent dehydrogenase (Short-subunit alcohol dehydrogenase family) n=1 Tax=Actinocrispum wychmicini TaxID=1213861 RepID=A0A4V2S6F9_9PSEU|nr:SDR family oxidoreductase [Actinocrispum wychmicini]TCO55890.1 NAD(P)-dependent dehydrogenase (short-subunit alcohol dehydrogenase family) [Actinocrispum wychmicini]